MTPQEQEAYAEFLRTRRAELVGAVRDACARAGRDPASVGMLAVSKTVGPEEVLLAWRAGWHAFAENRPQELARKLAFVEATPEMAGARFDMIGNLQRNKVNQVIGRAHLVHSVSSVPLARTLSTHSEARGLVTPVLLEVNVSGEESKGGFTPDGVRAAAEGLCDLAGIRVLGLMTMAPADDADAARRTFRGLAELAEELRRRTGLALPELSCGMSGDFEVAVEEGATLVRLGRCVFSPDFSLKAPHA